jgi:hypothetical protein
MLTPLTTPDSPRLNSSNRKACLSAPEIELSRLRAEKARTEADKSGADKSGKHPNRAWLDQRQRRV